MIGLLTVIGTLTVISAFSTDVAARGNGRSNYTSNKNYYNDNRNRSNRNKR